MALLGQGAQPVAIDYSRFAEDAWRLADSNVNSVSGAMNAVGDAIKDRREKKDKIKVSKELAKALSTLYPESAGAVAPILENLDNEELPLSQRAALGEQIGTLINMGVEKNRNDALFKLDERRVAIGERGMDIQEGVAQRETSLVEKAMADQEALTGFMARPALEQALRETVAAERRGETPLIGSERLKGAFLKQPDEQMQIVAAAMQGLPKAAPLEFRDVEFTRDGQPTKGTAVFDPRKGQFSLVPIADATTQVAPISQGSDGIFSVTTTNYSQGAAAGGPDEMQDKWTNQGYSSTGKNLTKGVVAVNDSVFPLGTVFRDASSGEVFIAADRHGNKDASVVDFYQPPGEYKATKGKRNLEVIGNVKPATTPEGIQAQIAQFQGRGGSIQPGAARSTTVKTPTEQKLDEAKLAKIEAETAAAGTEKGIAAAKVNNTAKRVFSVIEKYRTADGKPTQRLRDAVGFGEGVMGPITRTFDPEVAADQQELELELLETDLLNAAKDLKPVSEDEMKMLLARRPAITSPPEVWVRFMNRAEQIIKDGLTATDAAPVPPAQSAADRLRALKR